MSLERLRNIGIVAHIDAGKTTVTERILFYTGVEHRMGEVHDGTATMDWMTEERERGITITAAVTRCPWRDHVVQIIDTPGHVDFTAEVSRSLRVLDGAVVVICGVAGVQAQTETVLRQAADNHVPWVALVNKMDRQGADFEAAVQSLCKRGGVHAVPVHLPYGSGGDFEGIIDLVRMRHFRFDTDDQGRTVIEADIPEERKAAALEARGELLEAVAETDEELLEAYLSQDDLSPEQLQAGLRQATLNRALVPVLAASALRNIGVQPILDAALAWLPSPLDRPPVQGMHPVLRDKVVERPPDPQAPFCGLIFKVFHDPHGDLCFLRIYSGTLKEGDVLHNARLKKTERVQQIFHMHAERRERLKTAGPGAIVVLPGLKWAQTGDTLFHKGEDIALEAIEFPEPVIQQALEPQSVADRDKLMAALKVLDREDPTLHVSLNEETGQAMLAGMGELHLEVALHRLDRDFRVGARAGKPLVAYRETIARQRAGQGQIEVPVGETKWTVSVELEVQSHAEIRPALEWDSLSDFPPELAEALGREGQSLLEIGGDRGYPLAQVAVQVKAVRWNPSESTPAVEWVLGAASRALDQALDRNTALLEPLMTLRVEVPEEFLSGVLGDLNTRRATVESLEVRQTERLLLAKVPLECMFAYSTHLRSLTQGRGAFSLQPAGYTRTDS